MNLTPLDERRLADLKQIVADRALAAEPGRRARRRVLRPALALAATAGAVATGLVAASGGGGTPAFAVTRSAGGIATITITDFRHTAQLSQELRTLRIPAAVLYIPAGMSCYEGSAREVDDIPNGLYVLPANRPARLRGWQMQINTSLLKPGQTLLFGLFEGIAYSSSGTVNSSGKRAYAYSTRLITGKVTACQYRPAPPLSMPPSPSQRKLSLRFADAGSLVFPNSVSPAAPPGK